MGNVHMEATQINYRGGSKKMSVEEAIKAAGTEITPEEKTWIDSIPTLTTSKADNDVIATEFDSEAGVYAIGDLVMHEGKLYEFTTAHETAGDWDSTEVAEKTVSDEIDTLKSGLTNYKTVIGYDEVYNQWDELWEVGSIDTTTGGNTDNSSVIRSSGYIPVKPNTQYFFKAPGTGVAFFYGSNKAFISQSSTNVWQTFTTPANAYYMRFRLSSDYGTTYNNDVSVNFPATVTSYYPYHGVVDARLTNVELSFQSHDVSGADIAEILTNLLLWVRDSLEGGRTYILSGVFTNTTSTSSEDYNAVITKKSTHMYGMVSSGNFIYNTNYTAGVYRGLYKFEGTSLI